MHLTIDPITRIEGHLKIDVEIEDGVVKDAKSSGSLFRGFEIMLKGRDPRDAWLYTQRICGVCPISHGHASTLGLEDAFKVRPPDNARIIRNLLEGGQYLHSHILWFYHLNALDYVDVVSALSAVPTDSYLKGVQGKLKSFVDSGQLGPFANGYWGHTAYKLPSELNLTAVAHYLEAIEMQAKASHIVAILGGKMPMHMTSVPGGTTFTPNVDILKDLLFRIKEVRDWITEVFVGDVLAIAPYYLDWAEIGKGCGDYLAWGVFEDKGLDPKQRLLPRGAIVNDRLIDPEPSNVTEHVRHSWYEEYDGGKNPSEGVTRPSLSDDPAKYSWLKAPRLNDRPMEVGPLARVLVAYNSGQPDAKKLVDYVLGQLGVAGKVGLLKSVLGRIAARVVEARLIADKMEGWLMELIENIKSGDGKLFEPYDIPVNSSGVGLWEAPRGALGHWNQIEGRKLANYQCVVPTTWNASPRDSKEIAGPMEQALIGTPVADPNKPLEILRVVHSFDPCIACAVHIIEPKTNEIKKFKVC